MSEGNRLDHKFASGLAIELMRILRPACDRIEIAGSLRRNKPDVGDIELVCIPKEQTDLFGEKYCNANGISQVLSLNGAALHKDGEHFKQINLRHCMCDLFITTPECWGVIFMIRTGSADFSHKMVTPKQYGGYMPGYLKVKDGRLWNGSTIIETPEEKDVFNAYNMEYIIPEIRR
jgi:DNA polymerase/3'-5' exonuclease PolX